MKKFYLIKNVLLVFILLFLTSEISFANKHYVSTTGNDSDGLSWANAYADLQTALGAAVDGDTIAVAKGTYIPDASDRTVAFNMAAGVKVFGGFAGNEDITSVTIENRDFETNETILSGDLAGNDGSGIITENSYTVVIFDAWDAAMSNTTVLDGFTISGGNANGGSLESAGGGGIYMQPGSAQDCNPLLKNLVVKNNKAKNGAGLYMDGIININAAISPTVENVIFESNYAYSGSGGGIYMAAAPDCDVDPVLNEVAIINNEASASGGGAFLLGGYDGEPGTVSSTFNNVTFYGNACINSSNGTAIFIHGQDGLADPIFNNVIFYGNDESQIFRYADGGTTDPSFNHCLITGSPSSAWNTGLGNDLGGNIDGDPLLADPDEGNVDIIEGSPVLTTGDITYGVNIGYYQGSGITSPSITLVSDFTDFGTVEAGNISEEQTFTISGTDLLNTVTIKPPVGFEVSLSSGAGFFSQLYLFPSSGTITTTTIYIRFKPSETGDHSGNVTVSSTGISDQLMAVTAYAGGSPEISAIDNQSACSGDKFNVAFTVTDDDLSNISFDLSSSDETIVPDANMDVTGSLGSYTLNITPATAGTADITVQVTDGSLNTTSIFFSLTITERPSLVVDFTYSICNGDPVEVTFSSTGGTGTVSYKLNDGAYWLQTYYDYLSGGENIIVAKDEVGCTDTAKVNNINPDYLGGGFQLAQPITCTDDNDAIISVQPTGGWEEYKYSIDGINYQSDSIFINLEAGNYEIHVLDSGGCLQNIGSMQVLNPDQLIIDYINTTDPENGNNGEISVVAYGGTFPLTYALNSGTYQNESYFTGLTGGQYTVYVKDAHDCELSDEVNLISTGFSSEVLKLNLELYPNPASEVIYFDVNQIKNELDKIEIYNLRGQIILSKEEVSDGKIDIRNLNQGTYLLVFRLKDNKVINQKIILK
jgi:hypothetical protein